MRSLFAATGSVPLDRIIEVARVADTSDDIKHEGRFLVHVSQSKRIFEFRAPNAQLCEQWVDALQEQTKAAKAE